MTITKLCAALRPGTLILLALLATTSSFGQAPIVTAATAPKSAISLEPAAPSAAQPAVTHEASFENAPANFRSFASARVGQAGELQRLMLKFSASTKLTKITSGKEFQVEPGGSCVEGDVFEAGGSCSLLVRFTARGPGNRLGKVTIEHTASVTPMSIGLGGYGYSPVLSFTPAVISTVPASYPASKGLLSGAQNLAIDGGDTLYVADTGNNVVRSMDSSGIFSTISSGTVSAPLGVIADNFGEVYFTEPTQNLLFEIYAYGPQFQLSGTTSTACTVAAPCNISAQKVFTPGEMATDGYNRIFFVDGYYGAAEFVAQSQTASYAHLNDPFTFQASTPGVLAVDTSDNLYSFWYNGGVCSISSQTFSNAANYYSIYSKVAGGKTCGFAGDGGQARNAEISKNIGQMAFDLAGDLYFTDTANQRVRRIDYATGIINTIAGNGVANYNGDGGAATLASLSSPTGVGVDSQGQVYIISTAGATGTAQVIRKLTTNGALPFSSQVKGTNSSVHTITLTNTGNSELDISHAYIVGTNPGDFGFDAGTTSCNLTAGTLASGQSCKIGLVFKPTAAGTRTATVVILDNTVTNQNIIQLYGPAVLPSPTVAITAPATGSSVTSTATFKFSVTVTSTLTPAPTGTVTFTVDGAAIGSPVALSAGAASVTVPAKAAGTHTLAATYNGDANYAVTGPVTRTYSVTTAAVVPATVKLVSTANPVAACKSVSFAITVTGSTPGTATGAVQLKDGSTTLGTGSLASSGSIVLSTAALGSGTHTLVANYGGDATHGPSSTTLQQIVTPISGPCPVVHSGPILGTNPRAIVK